MKAWLSSERKIANKNKQAMFVNFLIISHTHTHTHSRIQIRKPKTSVGNYTTLAGHPSGR